MEKLTVWLLWTDHPDYESVLRGVFLTEALAEAAGDEWESPGDTVRWEEVEVMPLWANELKSS